MASDILDVVGAGGGDSALGGIYTADFLPCSASCKYVN